MKNLDKKFPQNNIWRRLAACGAAAWLLLAAAPDTERRQAVDSAAKTIGQQLDANQFEGIKGVAVLPLWNDQDPGRYATEAFKTAVTRTHYPVYLREDAEWDRLLGEMKWSALREDIMSSSTLQRFGRIAGVDAVLYGTVWEDEPATARKPARVSISVNLADVETGRLLWASGRIEGVGPAPTPTPAAMDQISQTAQKTLTTQALEFVSNKTAFTAFVIAVVVLVLFNRPIRRALRRR